MQVGIVLDRGLGGLAKTSKLTQKHKNKVKNVHKDSKDSKQVQKTQNCLKTLTRQFLTLNPILDEFKIMA